MTLQSPGSSAGRVQRELGGHGPRAQSWPLTVGLVHYRGDGEGDKEWVLSLIRERDGKDNPDFTSVPASPPSFLPSLLRSSHCPSVKFWVLQTTLNLNQLESRNYRTQGPGSRFPPEPVTTSGAVATYEEGLRAGSRAAGEEAP